MQKLILGRALLRRTARRRALIVANQPTWGLDIGAVAYVHAAAARRARRRRRGAADLGDLDEIIALADRIARDASHGRLSRAAARGSAGRAEHRPGDGRAWRREAGAMRLEARAAPSPLALRRRAARGDRLHARSSRRCWSLAAGAPVGSRLSACCSKGAFGSRFALSETLTRATPLILTGLAVAVAFRARLFNIGAEGQLYAGALAAVAVGGMHGGIGLAAPTGCCSR